MTAQTSTIFSVTSLIVAKFQALNLTIDGAPVSCYDGPEGPDQDNNFMVVMFDPDEPTSQNTLEWAALGSLARYENYDLNFGAFSYMGGDDESGTSGADDAQLSARNNCATMAAAAEAALLADVNLATQNSGTAPIIWCLLSGIDYGQMPPDEESGMGRYAFARGRIHVYNRLSGH